MKTQGRKFVVAILGAVGACSISVLAAEPVLSWTETGQFSAPEAVQAAAADDTHIYAITNSVIARYDRSTRQRVAVSRGPAKHLNSGFFYNGRLYCAHSNFPNLPEESEIKVLDPRSMELTTHHRFGNYGGSLTWAVRSNDHWWCNFARYGKDNEQTFLVKFDDQWREVGRWRYPPEVICKLGRYSLSGGLWRDGVLLATGHDEPVVFRLQLPEQGNVLKLLDIQKVPFTGQGIAVDPQTKGLVGIRRAARQVVFAREPETVVQ